MIHHKQSANIKHTFLEACIIDIFPEKIMWWICFWDTKNTFRKCIVTLFNELSWQMDFVPLSQCQILVWNVIYSAFMVIMYLLVIIIHTIPLIFALFANSWNLEMCHWLQVLWELVPPLCYKNHDFLWINDLFQTNVFIVFTTY
jgi:hypothetical protein